ncbi:MAG: magnesium/cobalt transporter CorA [Desulfobacterales bacterium]|jgi:magnesium transporter
MRKMKSIPLRLYQKKSSKIGQSPGTLTSFDEKPARPTEITLIDFDHKTYEQRQIKTTADLRELKDSPTNSWINVAGITDTDLVAEIGQLFDIHPLVLEDIVNPRQRIKFEAYDDYIFIVLKMITYSNEKESFHKENVSLILGKHFLISFQEEPGDVFDAVRKQLQTENRRVRTSGCDYLAYRLVDLIVDHYYAVVEKFGEHIERLEIELSEKSDSVLIHELQTLKRDLLLFLRAVLPLREALSGMMKEEVLLITDDTRVFFRDVNDHFMQVKDTIISFRELAAGMLDGYLSMVSYKMNEVMQVLTIFAATFIPLTFIAGVYGMNFEFMPELHFKFMYPTVWLLMIATAVSMLVYFKRKKWF